jgi:hypothetical protein
MGVEKKITQEGNGVDRPKKGDKVAMLYTGWLYDASASNNDFKGKMYVLCRYKINSNMRNAFLYRLVLRIY